MTNTTALALTIDNTTSLEVRVMCLDTRGPVTGLDHYRAFVRSVGESSFHISRADASSPGDAIEMALHAAGWRNQAHDQAASPENAARVLAAIEARRTGPILEAGRHGYHGVWVHPVVKAAA